MRGVICAAALLLAGPLAAQERMTQEQCLASWSALEALGAMPMEGASVDVDVEGWCLIENGTYVIDPETRMRLHSLRWRTSDLARFIDEGLPPRSIEVIATGFGIVAQTGDRVFDYLLGLQTVQEKSGFGLSVRWDGLQNVVFVDDAYFDFYPGNRIEATARIDGVNLTDATTIQTSLGAMGLGKLTVKADFDGWFETYLAMAIGTAVLQNNDVPPEAQVAALQQQALGFVSEISDDIIPGQSRDALAAFIESLPQPRGTAQLQISADPVIGAARAMPFMLMQDRPLMSDAIAVVLDGVTITFGWTPTGEAK